MTDLIISVLLYFILLVLITLFLNDELSSEHDILKYMNNYHWKKIYTIVCVFT